MRINVYAEELTKEVKLVETVARDTGIVHYGIRLYLHSSDLLHNRPDDDDRSAVTFWIPNCGSFRPSDLSDIFMDMAEQSIEASRKIGYQQ